MVLRALFGTSDSGHPGGALVREVADQLPALFSVTDRSGGCVFVNVAWRNFTGRTLAEELGDGWLEMVHPDDRPGFATAFRAAVKAMVDVDITYRLRDQQPRHPSGAPPAS